MQSQITIPSYFTYLLKDTEFRDEFVDGLVAISEGIEPKTASRGFIDEAFATISIGLIQQKSLKGLPSYEDSGKLSPSWTRRYSSVSRGWLPLNLSESCSLKKLAFTNITTAKRHELAQLEKTINDHFQANPKTRQLEHWLRYIVEVMSFCVRNELLDLD
jgi:hypothetical protein